jgi:hypothetical protein
MTSSGLARLSSMPAGLTSISLTFRPSHSESFASKSGSRISIWLPPPSDTMMAGGSVSPRVFAPVRALNASKSRQRLGCFALAIFPVEGSTRACVRSPSTPSAMMSHSSRLSPSIDLTGKRMIAPIVPTNSAIYHLACDRPDEEAVGFAA